MTRARWVDSALLVWSLVAISWVLGAFCLVSLTWDGSYYLFGTLQDGSPMMPHRRWFNWLLLTPVLWARTVIGTPSGLAVVHGLMCALVPLVSLATCLVLLRGKWARLRFWSLLGILLLPLPGQFPVVGEVTFALQISWVLFAFAWRGCPSRWMAAPLVAAVAMATLHPVAAPLFFLAAVTVAVLGFSGNPTERRRMFMWVGFFALASAAKFAEALLFATDYERANMHGAVWMEELRSGLQYTPFVALVPIFVDVALRVWISFRRKPPALPEWMPLTSRLLWGTAFVLGMVYSFDSGGWCCAISYRKFGIVVTAPFVILAAIDAWRLRESPHRPALTWLNPRIALIVPALLFALIFSGMALSWRTLWSSLQNQIAIHCGPVVPVEILQGSERDSALNHWSTTSLSLIQQGWNPQKVFVWNAPLQFANGSFHICPGDTFHCRDNGFKIGWIQQIATGTSGGR